MKNVIHQKIIALRNELHQHNYQYYVLNQPHISDYDFDMLLKELQDLENQHPEFFDPLSPTQRVGSDLNHQFQQVLHQYPMLSLGNTYSEEEVSEFYNRVRKGLDADFEIVCEIKYDGTSISLIYENGQFVRAVTRGDGTRGDDVTANVKTIKSIPLILKGNYPPLFEIRGEILMPWLVFDQLNLEREESGEPLFANPRNAGSGTLKLQNSAQVACRKLDSYMYSLLGENLPFTSHFNNLQAAKSWGFKISDSMRVCKTLDEIMEFIHFWDTNRKTLPVATDGIVLKVNSIEQQKKMGFTAKTPRWAIAYKYQAEKALTRLNSVSYQVGRTGAVTPVANLDPVLLSGTTVKRASLHNADIIESLDLHIGDMVYVEKGGEIIPKITTVELSKRVSSGEKIHFIENCPECDTKLIRVDGEAAYYCPNDMNCPPQIKGKMEHFVSRKAMNIDGLGSETIQLLYNNGLLKNVADIYSLTIPQLSNLERLGEKSAKNIVKSCENSKEIPFERVIFALGIRFVGETVAKKLAYAFHNMDRLKSATREMLIEVEEIGDRIAESVLEYFADEKHIILIDKLKYAGLKFELNEDKLQNRTDLLQGLSIVISGTFQRHSRDEYKSIIEQNGGKNSGSVSAKTSFILAGDNMGPEKRAKAEKLGVKLISENDFLTLIGEMKSVSIKTENPVQATLF